MLLNYALVFCQLVIGGVFALSAISKVRDFSSFMQAITTFKLLPARLSSHVACLILAAEGSVVLLLIIGHPTIGLAIANILLLVFSIALLKVLARKASISCNCFGATNYTVTVLDLWRNATLLVLGFGSWLFLTLLNYKAANVTVVEWCIICIIAALFVGVIAHLREIARLLTANYDAQIN